MAINEKLKEEFTEMIASYMKCVRIEHSDDKQIDMYAAALVDDFDMLLSADVEPVRHAEWAGTVCSNCGESTVDYYDCDYCPKCGAKMDLKEAECEK